MTKRRARKGRQALSPFFPVGCRNSFDQGSWFDGGESCKTWSRCVARQDFVDVSRKSESLVAVMTGVPDFAESSKQEPSLPSVCGELRGEQSVYAMVNMHGANPSVLPSEKGSLFFANTLPPGRKAVKGTGSFLSKISSAPMGKTFFSCIFAVKDMGEGGRNRTPWGKSRGLLCTNACRKTLLGTPPRKCVTETPCLVVILLFPESVNGVHSTKKNA